MDLELALAVFQRWEDGLLVSETVFHKAASVLSDQPDLLLEEARGLTKQAQEPKKPEKPEKPKAEAKPKAESKKDNGTKPPKMDKAVQKPKAPTPAAPAAPNPVDEALAMQVTPKLNGAPEGAPAAPEGDPEQALEEQEPSKEETQAELTAMDGPGKIEAVAPHLPPETIKRFGDQLTQAEEQMGTPVVDPTMVQKFVDTFQASDEDMQKAFLDNFKTMSKQMYSGQQQQQAAQPGAGAAPAPGGGNGQLPQ